MGKVKTHPQVHWLQYSAIVSQPELEKFSPSLPTVIQSILKLEWTFLGYRQVSNIKRILVDNKIVDHSDVVGATPVGAAPTTSSFSTQHLASLD